MRLLLKGLEAEAAEQYNDDPHGKESKELTSVLKLIRLYFKVLVVAYPAAEQACGRLRQL